VVREIDIVDVVLPGMGLANLDMLRATAAVLHRSRLLELRLELDDRIRPRALEVIAP
jgi:hypothetical protein